MTRIRYTIYLGRPETIACSYPEVYKMFVVRYACPFGPEWEREHEPSVALYDPRKYLDTFFRGWENSVVGNIPLAVWYGSNTHFRHVAARNGRRRRRLVAAIDRHAYDGWGTRRIPYEPRAAARRIYAQILTIVSRRVCTKRPPRVVYG